MRKREHTSVKLKTHGMRSSCCSDRWLLHSNAPARANQAPNDGLSVPRHIAMQTGIGSMHRSTDADSAISSMRRTLHKSSSCDTPGCALGLPVSSVAEWFLECLRWRWKEYSFALMEERRAPVRTHALVHDRRVSIALHVIRQALFVAPAHLHEPTLLQLDALKLLVRLLRQLRRCEIHVSDLAASF